MKPALGFTAAVAAAAVLGSRFSPASEETGRWYRGLRKSPLNPPDAAFPIAWTVLYTLMAVSAYRVSTRGSGPERSRALALWSAQLAVNAAWSPLFFGAKKPAVALADLAVLLPSIAAYTREAGRVDRPAAWMMAPYLAWVTFAGLLNTEIVRRNG